jgi:hypothetical protein
MSKTNGSGFSMPSEDKTMPNFEHFDITDDYDGILFHDIVNRNEYKLLDFSDEFNNETVFLMFDFNSHNDILSINDDDDDDYANFNDAAFSNNNHTSATSTHHHLST